MNPAEENNKQVHARKVSMSEQKVSKTVNFISITIVLLSLAMAAVLVYFNIAHWSIAASFGVILLFLAASIRIADQWEKAVVLRMGKFLGWGITCQNVGIKDIVIPETLADAMSKQAQAERERQARIILGTAETEIAEKFAEASKQNQDNPVALQLRGMNMLFEGLKEKGSLIIVPSSALESMNLGAIGGLAALSGKGAG